MMYNSDRRAVSVQARIEEVYSKALPSGLPAGGKLDAAEIGDRIQKKALLSVVQALVSTASDGSTIDLVALVTGLKIDLSFDGQPRVSLQQFHDAFVIEAGKDAAAAAAAAALAQVGKSVDPHIDELLEAMDADGDGSVSKVEFVEFCRANKPKHGPFSKVSTLQDVFGFNKLYEVTRQLFDDAFTANKEKGLRATAFEFNFKDGSGHDSSPYDGLVGTEL